MRAPHRAGRRSLNAWLGAAASAVAVLGLTGSAAAIVEAAPQPPPATVERPATHNDKARDGRFEFTVPGTDCTRIPGHRPDGRWCVVPLIVRNVGESPATFYDSRQRAYAAGRWFSAHTEAGRHMNSHEKAAGDAWLSPIQPGDELVCVLVFDVPDGSRITQVLLRDAWFGGVTVRV